MREQEEIERRQFIRPQGTLHVAFWPEGKRAEPHPDTGEEDRIREDAQPVKVDQYGGVAEPGNGHRIIRPARRIRVMRRRGDRTAKILKGVAEKAEAGHGSGMRMP